MYSLAASARVWARFPWVVRTHPDTYVTPVAIARLEELVSEMLARSTDFWGDTFPSATEPRLSMDYFLWRPSQMPWWENATALCTRTAMIPEAVLAVLIRAFRLRIGIIGGRAPLLRASKRQQIGACGLWHTHNVTAVQHWVENRWAAEPDMSLRLSHKASLKSFKASTSCCAHFPMSGTEGCSTARGGGLRIDENAVVMLGPYLQ